jgi:hypothetical protein
MTTNAYLSNIKVELADTTVSPITYSELEEVVSGVTVGETAPLVDVTHFQSTSREYISGLADGDEFSLECNAVTTSPAIQQQFIALKGETKTLRVTATNTRVSPNVAKYYTFSAVFLGWSLVPNVGEGDKLNFTFKITGGITRS